jgi:hypothetical protein
MDWNPCRSGSVSKQNEEHQEHETAEGRQSTQNDCPIFGRGIRQKRANCLYLIGPRSNGISPGSASTTSGPLVEILVFVRVNVFVVVGPRLDSAGRTISNFAETIIGITRGDWRFLDFVPIALL